MLYSIPTRWGIEGPGEGRKARLTGCPAREVNRSRLRLLESPYTLLNGPDKVIVYQRINICVCFFFLYLEVRIKLDYHSIYY